MRVLLLFLLVTGIVACRSPEPPDPGVARTDGAPAAAAPALLRVCADPNNLPFSNDRQEGFENRLATLIARELGREVTYTWWAQRRGFLRSTLNAGACDVVMGLPAESEGVLTTRPYYASTYVFVSRRDRQLDVQTFDDPRLRTLRVGVPLVGDDGANPPPAHALSRRGIVRNIVGYSVYGDYSQESPPSEIVKAVARGDVDIAIAWGPLAGYYATRQPVPLAVVPVTPERDAMLPFVFSMAMGVRRGDEALRAQLDAALSSREDAIRALLTEYGVPLVEEAGQEGAR